MTPTETRALYASILKAYDAVALALATSATFRARDKALDEIFRSSMREAMDTLAAIRRPDKSQIAPPVRASRKKAKGKKATKVVTGGPTSRRWPFKD